MAKKNPSQWKKDWIVKHQLAIKSELDAVEKVDGASAKLRHILDRVVSLSEEPTSSGRLRTYVYCMSALVHHVRQGGLSERDITQVSNLAVAILRRQGVLSKNSALTYLYGDVHQILAQIFQKDGDLQRAGWHQSLAYYHTKSQHSAGLGARYLSMGIRKGRLAHAPEAFRFLELAEKEPLDVTRRARTHIEKCRLLRLSGALAAAAREVESALRLDGLPAPERMEFEWEKLCETAVSTGDLGPMMSAVQRGGSHHEAIYISEAFVWTRLIEKRQWLLKFSGIGKVAWKMKKELRGLGAFYECAKVLEGCYDFSIPFPIRLQKMEGVVKTIPNVTTLEKELQLWAAFGRWLIRSKADVLAEHFLAQYRALSLSVSTGKTPDALGVLGDLFTNESESPDIKIIKTR